MPTDVEILTAAREVEAAEAEHVKAVEVMRAKRDAYKVAEDLCSQAGNKLEAAHKRLTLLFRSPTTS